ncbi:hypothetical protein Hanom_Chr08g00724751 [Helianthus anomalus]
MVLHSNFMINHNKQRGVCSIKVAQNLTANVLSNSLFMVQNAIRGCYHHIAPLH